MKYDIVHVPQNLQIISRDRFVNKCHDLRVAADKNVLERTQ